MEFESLKGITLAEITQPDSETMMFTSVDGDIFKLYYVQDCCGSCYVEDICGDLNDLIGSPILLAEEAVGGEPDGSEPEEDEYGSHTWSFYKLSTVKGSVTIRWYGSSNGYYSETVTFIAMVKCKVCKDVIDTDRYSARIEYCKADDGAILCSENCLAVYHTIPLCYE